MRSPGLPVALLAFLCSGCGVDPVSSVAMSLGSNLAVNTLFGESKMKRDARAAFERAPPCTSMSRGVSNGRVTTIVRDVAWFDSYVFPDGRRLEPSKGNGLVMVDYVIENRSDDDVTVTPRQLTVTDAKGRLTHQTAGVGGSETDEVTPDEGAILPVDRSWPMVSVFEIPPGEYALMVPNGRTPDDPEPTWVDGCRFPGPNSGRTRS
ncbi:MAG: hypothetical protein ACHQK9_07375 [Reyranellales bacterium]